MFNSLTSRLQDAFRELRKRGKLRPEDIDQAAKSIRIALLEADVNYQVAKSLLENVRQLALGEEVSQALNPAQQVIRIIHQELVRTLGESGRLNLTGEKPRVIMLVGLQGSGKTTTAAKLAGRLRARGERVAMVAADPYRPAAVEQLKVLGRELDVTVYHEEGLAPADLCANAAAAAARAGVSVLILDTAGRSQLDDTLMLELQQIQSRVRPSELLLVADAMTGQEAVSIASGFHDRLGLTGLILSKMDGDARGGAAISMRAVTGVPIKFIGTGESRDALETFEPERLASRILGMGDVLSLIEKAEQSFDQEQAADQAERMLKGRFTLEDFQKQLEQMQRMGPLEKVMEMIPGFSAARTTEPMPDMENQLKRTQAIVRSMTPIERRKPEILNASRKRRIAAGSGTTVQEVNQLLRQFRQMQKMLKKLGGRGLSGIIQRLQ
ncbi:MAG: signal recognition particle protein [Anaerolineales bacterium]|nr:signal recognition particle protein [Anaerolineales bacterium]